MGIFLCWIDNLQESDRNPFRLSNKLLAPGWSAMEFLGPVPIVIRVGGDNVLFLIPLAEQATVDRQSWT